MSCVVSSRNESIAKGVESLRENQPRLSDNAIVVGVVPMAQSSLLRNALIDGPISNGSTGRGPCSHDTVF